MSKAELRDELLNMLRSEAAQGRGPRASEVLQQASKRWDADEFAVREAIWYLLSTNQIDLTDERTLRPTEEIPAVQHA